MTTTTAPFVRTLHQDDTGPDVEAVARALQKWAHQHKVPVPHGFVISGEMGAEKTALLRTFQQRNGLHVDGIYGPQTHAKLAPFFDLYGTSLLQKEKSALEAAAAPGAKLLAVADQTVTHEARMYYTEGLGDGPGERGYFRTVATLNWETGPTYTCDCSGHYLGCGKHAGLKHPIFESTGDTETIRTTLTEITEAEAVPGDCALFMDGAVSVHVTILRARLANGDWEVDNMGRVGEPIRTALSAERANHPGDGTIFRRTPA